MKCLYFSMEKNPTTKFEFVINFICRFSSFMCTKSTSCIREILNHDCCYITMHCRPNLIYIWMQTGVDLLLYSRNQLGYTLFWIIPQWVDNHLFFNMYVSLFDYWVYTQLFLIKIIVISFFNILIVKDLLNIFWTNQRNGMSLEILRISFLVNLISLTNK